MTRQVIADTGVLVALVDKRESHHVWAKERAAELTPPFLTCEPVLAEACFVVQRVPDGEQQILSFLKDGYVRIDFSLSAEIAAVAALMKKYESIPMSLADACLVRMSELNESASVFTLDSDFRIYRRNGTEAIPLIIPDVV